MVNKKFVTELVNTYLRMYRRFDEHVFKNTRAFANEIIKIAHEEFEEPGAPKSTEWQVKRFRRRMEKQSYTGQYFSLIKDLTDDNLPAYIEANGNPDLNGMSIAKSVMYHLILYQGQILLYSEGIADMVLNLVKKQGVPDEHVPSVTKFLVRSVIGHERRHKTQQFFEDECGNLWEYLTYEKSKDSLAAAKEEDAEFWAAGFLDWFGDSNEKINQEKHWSELAKTSDYKIEIPLFTVQVTKKIDFKNGY